MSEEVLISHYFAKIVEPYLGLIVTAGVPSAKGRGWLSIPAKQAPHIVPAYNPAHPAGGIPDWQ